MNPEPPLCSVFKQEQYHLAEHNILPRRGSPETLLSNSHHALVLIMMLVNEQGCYQDETTCRHKVVHNCPVSQNWQSLCIDGCADICDTDVEHISKVNQHHCRLAGPPVVPFILQKPSDKSELKSENECMLKFHLARAHSPSFHLTITSWFSTKASGGQSSSESSNFSFSSRLSVLSTSLWLSSWKYTCSKQTSTTI